MPISSRRECFAHGTRSRSHVLEYEQLHASEFTFENHLNYFHERGEPLDKLTALGLCAYLNSTFLDTYFRQFSGHTQVNATDLRNLRYPTRDTLKGLGGQFLEGFPEQPVLDDIVAEWLARDPSPLRSELRLGA